MRPYVLFYRNQTEGQFGSILRSVASLCGQQSIFVPSLKSSSASEVRRPEIQTPGKAITDPSAEPRRCVNVHVDVL